MAISANLPSVFESGGITLSESDTGSHPALTPGTVVGELPLQAVLVHIPWMDETTV